MLFLMHMDWMNNFLTTPLNRLRTTFTVPTKSLRSTDDALVQMNAISKSILTEELKWFLLHNLPKTIDGEPRYRVAVADPILARYISSTTRFPTETRVSFDYIMRGFRLEIDKFMGGPEPGDLQKVQLNLARHYRKRSCMYKDSSMTVSSSPAQGVVVVPHTFEGLFLAKGKEDEYFICTTNLAPGEALYGDELIYVQVGFFRLISVIFGFCLASLFGFYFV